MAELGTQLFYIPCARNGDDYTVDDRSIWRRIVVHHFGTSIGYRGSKLRDPVVSEPEVSDTSSDRDAPGDGKEDATVDELPGLESVD